MISFLQYREDDKRHNGLINEAQALVLSEPEDNYLDFQRPQQRSSQAEDHYLDFQRSQQRSSQAED